jgi:hypothetical protein
LRRSPGFIGRSGTLTLAHRRCCDPTYHRALLSSRKGAKTDFGATSFELAPNLFYLNAFEPLISCMETATVSAFNAVQLVTQRLFDYTRCASSISITLSFIARSDQSWAEWD